MPIENINLSDWTFKGRIKTAASKDRIVPIHSAIRDMVTKRINENGKSINNPLVV